MFLSLVCICGLGIETPWLDLIGRGGVGGRLDVVVRAFGGVGSSTSVVVPRQVTPRREIERSGGVARQKPDVTPWRQSPSPRRKHKEKLPAGSIATVDDLKPQTRT